MWWAGRQYFKCSTHINSLKHAQQPSGVGILFYGWRNETQELSNLPKVAQLVRGRAGNWSGEHCSRAQALTHQAATTVLGGPLKPCGTQPSLFCIPTSQLSPSDTHTHRPANGTGSPLPFTAFATRTILLYRTRLGALGGQRVELQISMSLLPLILVHSLARQLGAGGSTGFQEAVHMQAGERLGSSFDCLISDYSEHPSKYDGMSGSKRWGPRRVV